jgi:fructoselysine-6-P-deglycase FrlB-like protein
MNQMMAREIAAQAEVLSSCVGPLAQTIAAVAPASGRILAGGCGDSAFAPAALAGVFAALNIEITAHTSQSLASFIPLSPSDTVILASISGGTRRTVEAAQAARTQGARVIALTCDAGSPLGQVAHATILLPFSPLSRKTPHTLDYSVTLLGMTLVALAWSGNDDADIGPVLQQLPHALAAAQVRAKAIARLMNIKGKLFLLGAGPELASAEYGAAKFHEAGGLIAIAAETENFIHGANFMVEPEDAILALGGNSPGMRRGEDVTSNFRDFVVCSEIVAPGSFAGEGWRKAFADLLSTTFTLQHLCLAVADAWELAVEQPRAGRAHGETHLAIQSRIMAS